MIVEVGKLFTNISRQSTRGLDRNEQPMKNCTYCGRENADEAVQCRECGTEFAMQSRTSEADELPIDDPERAAANKRMLWGAVWCGGGIIVTVVSYFAAASSPIGGTYVVAWGAILFGGFGAAGSLLQRRLGLPDASVLVLQGIAFVLVLASEALRDVDWKAATARLKRFGPAPAPVTP